MSQNASEIAEECDNMARGLDLDRLQMLICLRRPEAETGTVRPRMSGDPTDRQLAVEELRLLAGIIARKEEVRLRQRNWVITIVAGLGVAHFSARVDISDEAFLALGSGVILTFWIMETIYQHVEDRAITRSNEVEQLLREGSPYDGPMIGVSLTPPPLSAQLRFLRRTMFSPRVASPYVALLAMLLLYAVAV